MIDDFNARWHLKSEIFRNKPLLQLTTWNPGQCIFNGPDVESQLNIKLVTSPLPEEDTSLSHTLYSHCHHSFFLFPILWHQGPNMFSKLLSSIL